MSLKTGLVHYYKLDEASGTALDAHGSVDLPVLIGSPVGVTGKIGTARSFTPSQSLGANNHDLTLGDADFSGACWLYWDGGGFVQQQLTLGGVSGSDPGLAFYVNTGPVVGLGVWQTNGTGVTATATITQGIWQYWAWTHDVANKSLRLYRNGTLVDTAVYTGTLRPGSRRLVFASRNSDRYFNGLMDEVSFWDRKLTDAEVALLYNDGEGLSYDNFDTPTAKRKRRIAAAQKHFSQMRRW